MNLLTRAEEAAIAEVEAAYKKLTNEAKTEFHSAIQVYEAHPMAMMIAGFAFGLLFAWVAF